ncbi:DUF1330 domain-containing protein [Nocardia bhagyanarayanae]|uniref:Uncharacterized protein (DUF1330 family) n=1 Tax=Nocardia bhagyanarayanae TaxID=1215925 RepID=A0A543EV41_9NOCA|nr:DUF1330 domain-containing protein [Nocardia bhagyanarayanae]TQM25448.1 uncharacterized protein (DUF1330 family) [Nocardia bhagyanarayanae]
MAAYLIVDAEDLVVESGGADGRADEYRAVAQASIDRYGGRYLVRGASPVAVEGDWPDGRVLTVIEFPDRACLERWRGSAEYGQAAAIRKISIDARMVIADGVIPGEC